MSQFSETNFSDIIPDVDKFIRENQLNGIVMETGARCLTDDSPDYFQYTESLTQDAGLQDNDYKLPMDNLLTNHDYSNGNLLNYHDGFIKYPPDEVPTLEIDEYSGCNEFEVLILPNGQKIPWEFSSKLNKIFITMCAQFPVAFGVKNRPTNTTLFVRATPVFSRPQHLTELVHRCVGHEHANDNSNKGYAEHIHQHVIRCQNPDARYCGNKDLGKRLSVIVPLHPPQAGTDTVKEYYSFVCKNSCAPGGMSRRPIQVIFTLENENGVVLGRRVISVRVCSCPKRDKDKEEKATNATKVQPPSGKRRKTDTDEKKAVTSDNRIFPLNFNVTGKENYKKILEFSRALMSDQILNNESTKNCEETAAAKKCRKEITDLLSTID